MTLLRLRPARARRRGPDRAAQRRSARSGCAPLIAGGDDALAVRRACRSARASSCSRRCAARAMEGVVSKRADAPYRGGADQGVAQDQMHPAAGVRDRRLDRRRTRARGFRSLLLGVNEDGELRYAGKVGTGFDAATMDDLREQLDQLARKTPTGRGAARGGARRALGDARAGRRDRLCRDHARRRAAPFELPGPARRQGGARGGRRDARAGARRARRSTVKVTNRDRVIFPEATSPRATSPIITPQVAPVDAAVGRRTARSAWSAARRGARKHCFFQKHDAGIVRRRTSTRSPIREKDGSTEDYLYVDDADGLVACVQMGTIEFHGWGSSVDALEKPDRLVFDLDPDEGLDFDDTKTAAEHLKDQLAELGLTSFPMLSGGKGVHVVVPLTPAGRMARGARTSPTASRARWRRPSPTASSRRCPRRSARAASSSTGCATSAARPRSCPIRRARGRARRSRRRSAGASCATSTRAATLERARCGRADRARERPRAERLGRGGSGAAGRLSLHCNRAR